MLGDTSYVRGVDIVASDVTSIEKVGLNLCQTCQQTFDIEVIICPYDSTALTRIIEEQLEGTVFGDRYEIISLIGEGGMGKVYKARHKLMKRTIAIKLVHQHLISSGDTLTRFRKEAEAASCLNHWNIVGVHDFGLLPRAYLVMDYLEGISLADVLEIKPNNHLDLARSLSIFIQMCAGL